MLLLPWNLTLTCLSNVPSRIRKNWHSYVGIVLKQLCFLVLNTKSTLYIDTYQHIVVLVSNGGEVQKDLLP